MSFPVEHIAKWLVSMVEAGKFKNPIPYPPFRTTINKWIKSNDQSDTLKTKKTTTGRIFTTSSNARRSTGYPLGRKAALSLQPFRSLTITPCKAQMSLIPSSTKIQRHFPSKLSISHSLVCSGGASFIRSYGMIRE